MATQAFPLEGATAEMPRESPPEVVLRNCTPARLSVQTGNGRLVIPPLGHARAPASAIGHGVLATAERAGVLSVDEDDPGPDLASSSAALASVVVALGIGGLAGADAGSTETTIAICAAIVAVLAVALWRIPSLRFSERFRELAILSLTGLVVISLPGLILYFGSDVRGLVRLADEQHSHEAAVALIGIGVQFLSIVGASALPVVLYFIFDRERLQTLRQRVTRHIFRLDRGMRTLSDIDAKYGQWLDEAFGRRGGEARYLPGTRWPILIAASVLSLGWAVALLDTKPTGAGSLTALIQPTPAAPTYAFLGAYFFTLNSVMRGFVRGDLRPKTYAQIATRIVGAVVLAFALERLLRGVGGDPSSATLLTFAFLVGIVPETFLIRLQEVARTYVGRRARAREMDHASLTYETEPLTRLQGIDIYDRARLLDEGVTNVEGLAHHDLVELLLKTRIPANCLVDWADQAILFIHCSCVCGDRDPDGGQSVLTQLRGHGIRTATELRRAYEESDNKAAFARIVTTPPGKPSVIPVVLDAIAAEPWIDAIDHWRRQRPVPKTIRVPESL